MIDASAAIELLRQTDAGRQVRAALMGQSLVAPSHFDAEVLMGLARHARRHSLPDVWVDEALRVFGRMPVVRYPVRDLLTGAWSLRANVAMGDAIYVDLAFGLRAALLTLDGRLARGAAGLGVEIRLVTA